MRIEAKILEIKFPMAGAEFLRYHNFPDFHLIYNSLNHSSRAVLAVKLRRNLICPLPNQHFRPHNCDLFLLGARVNH